jgi:hypothetical protein
MRYIGKPTARALSVILFAFPAALVAQSSGTGPFGLTQGMTLPQLRAVMKVDPSSVDLTGRWFRAEKVPLPHSEFESYMLLVSSTVGLCKVRGIGKDILGDSQGSTVTSAFERIDEVAYLPGYLTRVADVLKKASIRTVDFESTIEQTKKGDLLFVDPPYTVMHNNNNFVKYNSHLFSWDDQQRLAAALRRAARRGAHVILSNADHQSVRDLYQNFGTHIRLSRSTVLAAGSKHRCATTELVVTTLP